VEENVMQATIGFIGGGKMAEAIIAAWVRVGVVAAEHVLVSDVSDERCALLAQEHGVRVTRDNAAVLAQAATVVLAVKPQQLDEVLAGLAPQARAEHLVLSIAAGKRLAYFEARLPAARIVRVMPNIAALAGASMNVFCLGARCVPADRDRVQALLNACGRALELPEAQFDAVTALSGSGPAFFAHLVEAAVQGAVALGLRDADARVLAYQTLLGTATLLTTARFTPDELIRAVSSAKGTTVAGMEVLTRTTVTDDLRRTLEAAARRSQELSG
jgi:pyrroline-5-carboxylate reductase